MNISEILSQVEASIQSKDERTYFLIHEARYKRVLEEVSVIASTHQRVNEKNADTLTHRHTDALKVLDVGCYPYHMGAALEIMGHEVWGIASSHEPIKNKKVAILNIETDPFPHKDNFFDLVLCSEVIEHLPHSPIPALKEMYRVTKRGGHLLVTTPNIIRSINQGKMLLGRAPSYHVSAFLENEGRGSNLYHRHNREFTLAELTHLVTHAGWRIEQKTHFISYTPFRRKNRHDNPLLWTGKFANYVAMTILPRLRDTLLIVGIK